MSNFLKGVGSVLSISPDSKLPKPSSPKQLSEKSWKIVGNAMKSSMNGYDSRIRSRKR